MLSIDPAEPIDRIDPAEPIDRMDPAEPIDRMDPAEPRDSNDPADEARVGVTCIASACPPRRRMPSVQRASGASAGIIVSHEGARVMRAVAARVTSASVRVGGQVVGAIDEPGLLVLIGVTHSDTPARAVQLARKLHGLRILRDEQSCESTGAPLLVVSQFTLYGQTVKGRRPSWIEAAPAEVAEPLVNAVVDQLRQLGATVATGEFGADMAVASVNDGPFTVLVEL